MTTSTNNTDSKTDSTTTQNQNNSGYGDPNKEDVKPTEPESNVDDYGYDKIADDKKPSDEDDKPEEDKKSTEDTEDKKVENPATGYGGDDKPEPTDEDKDKKPEEKKPDVESDTEALKKEDIDSALGELPEGYDKDRTSKFALDNKMTKEQIDAYVKLAQQESEEVKIADAEQVKTTREGWTDELKNDHGFGGENFDKNVHRVEQILDKHMPNTKKALTDNGGMLPPYVMRDFLSLAKTLNPTTKLVNGEPSKVEVEKGNFLDEMYK